MGRTRKRERKELPSTEITTDFDVISRKRGGGERITGTITLWGSARLGTRGSRVAQHLLEEFLGSLEQRVREAPPELFAAMDKEADEFAKEFEEMDESLAELDFPED